MKQVFFTILLLMGLLFVAGGTRAADYNFTCIYESGCSPSVPAFFPTSEVWYPGKTLTKTVKITNGSTSGQKVGFTPSNNTTTGGLDQMITMVITRSDSSVAWSGLLSAFYTSGETELLSSLGNGASETFAFTATMDPNAGNEYQNTATQFDLTLGFISPLTGKTSSLSTSCTNSNFDAIMNLKYDGVGQSGIKVKFTYKGEVKEATTGSNGKAQVGYTHTGDDTIKAEPEEGYPSLSMVIKLTSCNSTVSTTAGTESVLGAFTQFFRPFGGGEGEVAGVATTPIPTVFRPNPRQFTRGEVEGATTQCTYIWWQILLGVILVASFVLKRFRKIFVGIRYLLFLIGGSLISYLLFKLINTCQSPSFFRTYFAVLSALVIHIIKLLMDRKNSSDAILTE